MKTILKTVILAITMTAVFLSCSLFAFAGEVTGAPRGRNRHR